MSLADSEDAAGGTAAVAAAGADQTTHLPVDATGGPDVTSDSGYEAAYLRELGRLDLASRSRTNTLIVVPPEPANTNIPGDVAARITGPGRTVIEVNAAAAATTHELLSTITAACGERLAPHAVPTAESDDRHSVLRAVDLLADLTRLGATSEHDVVVVIVDLRPEVAHQLFGILRDEVWETRLTWILISTPPVAEVLTRPPADSFFLLTLDLTQRAPKPLCEAPDEP